MDKKTVIVAIIAAIMVSSTAFAAIPLAPFSSLQKMGATDALLQETNVGEEESISIRLYDVVIPDYVPEVFKGENAVFVALKDGNGRRHFYMVVGEDGKEIYPVKSTMDYTGHVEIYFDNENYVSIQLDFNRATLKGWYNGYELSMNDVIFGNYNDKSYPQQDKTLNEVFKGVATLTNGNWKYTKSQNAVFLALKNDSEKDVKDRHFYMITEGKIEKLSFEGLGTGRPGIDIKFDKASVYINNGKLSGKYGVYKLSMRPMYESIRIDDGGLDAAEAEPIKAV